MRSGEGQGEEDAEGGAGAWGALDLQASFLGFNDHFAVKHTDAEAVSFGGLEGAEEGTADEIGGHPAAVVDDLEDGPGVAGAEADVDFAVGRDGFTGIKDEIDDDFLELFGVEGDRGYGMEITDEAMLIGGGAEVVEGLGDQGGEVGGLGGGVQLLPEAGEAGDEVVKVFDAFGHGTEGIIAEGGVGEVTVEVLQGEGEGGSGIFEVVDKEGGHGLESLHFLIADQLGGQLEAEEIGGDLITDAFEEVEVFGGEGGGADSVAEDEDAEEAVGGEQRLADGRTGLGEDAGVQFLEGGGPGVFAGDDDGGFAQFGDGLECGADGITGQVEAVGGIIVEGGGAAEAEAFAGILDQPDIGGQGMEGGGEPGGDGAAEGVLLHEGRGISGEGVPDAAVIMFGSAEVTGDPLADPLAEAFGEEEDGESDQADEDEEGLEGEGIGAAEAGKQVGEDADDEQVGTGDDDGEGSVNEGLGRIDIDIENGAAGEADGDQDAADPDSDGGGTAEGIFGGGIEDGLAGGIEAEAEHDTDPEDEVFDAPAHDPDGAAEGTFQVGEDGDGGEEEPEFDEEADPAEAWAGAEGGGFGGWGSDEVVKAEDGDGQGDQAGGEPVSGLMEGGGGVTAGVGATEDQPGGGEDRGEEEAQLLPGESGFVGAFLPGESGEDGLAGEHDHADGERHVGWMPWGTAQHHGSEDDGIGCRTDRRPEQLHGVGNGAGVGVDRPDQGEEGALFVEGSGWRVGEGVGELDGHQTQIRAMPRTWAKARDHSTPDLGGRAVGNSWFMERSGPRIGVNRKRGGDAMQPRL